MVDVIQLLLPHTVVAVESFVDVPGAFLFPEEEQAIVRAVAKRRQEFTTARWCARAALGRLGITPAPILPGERGAPRWPDGIVGSITHCNGYRAAAVARREDIASVGIDAEPNEPLPDGVLDAVAGEGERERIGELLIRYPEVRWDRCLFSAKEAVYKTWYPLAQRWLDFHEADLFFDPVGGTFRARLLAGGVECEGQVISEFLGRWDVSRSLITTTVTVAAERRRAEGERRY